MGVCWVCAGQATSTSQQPLGPQQQVQKARGSDLAPRKRNTTTGWSHPRFFPSHHHASDATDVAWCVLARRHAPATVRVHLAFGPWPNLTGSPYAIPLSASAPVLQCSPPRPSHVPSSSPEDASQLSGQGGTSTSGVDRVLCLRIFLG